MLRLWTWLSVCQRYHWHHGQGGAASCRTRCPSGVIGNVSENASLSYPRMNLGTAWNPKCLSLLKLRNQQSFNSVRCFTTLRRFAFWSSFRATSNAEVFWKKLPLSPMARGEKRSWRFCKVTCSTWGAMDFDVGVTVPFHVSVKLRFLMDDKMGGDWKWECLNLLQDLGVGFVSEIQAWLK